MEGVRNPETSVYSNTTRRYIPDGCIFNLVMIWLFKVVVAQNVITTLMGMYVQTYGRSEINRSPPEVWAWWPQSSNCVQEDRSFYNQFCNLQVLLDVYNMNREWELISITSYRNSGQYSCCPNDTYPSVTFQMVLQRHSGSYTAIVVSPAIGECWLYHNFVL